MSMRNKIIAFMHQKIAILDEEKPYSVAARAKLRQSIGKPLDSVPNVWDIILSSDDDLGKNATESMYTAIGLYALHRQGKPESMNEKGIGFGKAIAGLARGDEEKQKSVTRKFNAVATSTGFSELAHHARSLVQMLKSENIKMDYPRFACDLYAFQFPEGAGKLRLRWGEEFYQTLYKNEKENDKNEK